MNNTHVLLNSSDATRNTNWDVAILGNIYVGGAAISASYSSVDKVLRGSLLYGTATDIVSLAMNVVYQSINCSTATVVQKAADSEWKWTI
jgi:hypothetical protein